MIQAATLSAVKMEQDIRALISLSLKAAHLPLASYLPPEPSQSQGFSGAELVTSIFFFFLSFIA